MPNRYRIVATKTFIKDLKKVPPRMFGLIAEKKNQLAVNPYFVGKKLTNMPFGQWRTRVGDYRIRYDIEGDEVVLLMIRHRKDIYKK